MKIKAIALILVLVVSLFSGCGREPAPAPTQPPQTTPPETTPDVVTTASIVNTAGAFEQAISSTGTWLIAITEDLTIDRELVLDGEFKNGRKDDDGKDIIQRKIALYTQDENRNVTARFTLTAPRLTVNSPEARIQSGTFKGDVYVSARNFQLVDATIDGNLYFTTDEAQETFQMDDTSKVTGEQALKK
ncbi:hypothetical protein [Geosporobacter ferrireducens]|uniref:LPS export ABC transporter periplasmic protein LptC n=1 Tax=Geosporobacter ferrireducens TaxID=1424294 RepID=A0A1D8GFF2_9FIRM|nr:hypothetical protein [Geosporobacter ferrireducens]AOT69635.1 hypothetical protein Gferi_08620 [Geosporobacter ferrireducens]MTI54662.1 hypothetical protein [Geosporobacter ferrireducens]